MPQLTDTQLVLLSKASQREDHAVELPPKLRGAAAQHVITPLLERCLLEEILATTQMPAWRRAGEDWPAAGFVDTGIRCLTELESGNAKKEVQRRVQA